MPDPLLFLRAMGAAAIVSAIFVLALMRVRQSASTNWLNIVCGLGMCLGLAAGYYVLSLRLVWPPANGLDRFVTIVVPATLVCELMAGWQAVPRWLAWSLRVTLAAAIPRILLHGSVYLSGSDNGWTAWQAVVVLAVCGALLAGLWGLLAWLSVRSPGVSISLALGLTTLSAGLAVMLAGYIKGGAATLPLAAALVATTIAASLSAKRVSPPVMLAMGVVGLCSLLLIGRFYGRLSTGSAVALLLTPLLCWTTEAPLFRYCKPWLIASIRLLLVALPLLIVLILAKRNFDQQMAPLLESAAPSSTSSPPP